MNKCPSCKGFRKSGYRWKTLEKGIAYQCRSCGAIVNKGGQLLSKEEAAKYIKESK